MSSTASHALPGDPKNGGALFRLPPEIRDTIYRYLVKDCYVPVKPSRLYRHSGSGTDVGRDAGLDFSVLRVSKVVCGEAIQILYSESVFRFDVADLNAHVYGFLDEYLDRVAPMMMKVILDVPGMSAAWSDYSLEAFMSYPIKLFGGIDIRRRSLRVRILKCTNGLEGTTMSSFCQQLKAFVGFNAVGLFFLHWLLGRCGYHTFDRKEKSECITNFVSRLMVAVAEQLEPTFGPAISSFKSDAGNAPVPSENILCLDDSVAGFLKFRPGKHIIGKDVVEGDRGVLEGP